MKTIIATAAGLGLLLGGCANTHVYTKDGANVDVTHADMMACKSVMAPLTGDQAKEAFDKCMADKGYEKKVDKYRL